VVNENFILISTRVHQRRTWCMNFSKIAGWLIIITGLLIIGGTLLSSYNIFTAKTEVPEFFKAPAEEQASQTSGTQDIQAQLQDVIQEQLKGVIPTDSIIGLFNLAVWSMLAFLLIFGGTQIAGLGIKLIKI